MMRAHLHFPLKAQRSQTQITSSTARLGCSCKSLNAQQSQQTIARPGLPRTLVPSAVVDIKRQRQEEASFVLRAAPSKSWSRSQLALDSARDSLMLDVAFTELVLVLVMWKQASKILALRSSRQLNFHNFRWSGQQSLGNPAVFPLPLQPASVLQTPASPGASRCLYQHAGNEQIDLNYRSVSCQA